MAPKSGPISPSQSPSPSKPAARGSSSPPAPAGEPQQIGKYQIQKKIGAGGMGAVYLAMDTTLKRQVALKLLPREKAGNQTLVKRFKAEAQAAANLRHDNIVMVYEAGEADGSLYIAMEFVDGTDVANLVAKRGVLPVSRSIEIIKQIAKALQHAHEKGIVHRDIKPGNILLRRDGLAKLADMGLARSLDDHADTGITRAGTTVGTVDYMSPEQSRDSKAADVRSDLYSLGCTWYYMLTGSAPFSEGSMTNKLRAHAETPLPDPRDKNSAVPEGVFAVLRRMTEKDPDRRYQTPSELIEDLDNTALSRNLVSDAIMSEIEEEQAEQRGPSKAGKKKVAASPSGSDLPRYKKPSPKAEKEPSPEFNRAVLFYGVVGLVLVGIVYGLAMLVKQFGSAFDAPLVDNAGNPFTAKNLENPQDASNKKAGGGGETTQQHVNLPPDSGSQGSTRGPGSNPNVSRRTETVVTVGGAQAEARRDAFRKRQETENAQLPEWVTKADSTASLPVLTVRKGASGERQFGSLNEALDQIPAGGAVIAIAGDGSFPLFPVKLSDRGRVVIRAADESAAGNRPLIVPVAAGRTAAPHHIDAEKTSLELRNVHLGLDAASWGGGSDGTLLHVAGGDVILKNCSVTVLGKTASPLTIVRMSGSSGGDSPAQVPRLLLASTVIRGNAATALRVDASRVDAVIRNCLLVSGAAPAVAFGKPSEGATDGSRIVRLVSSTVCASQSGIRFDGPPATTGSTEITVWNSLLSTPTGNRPTTLLSFSGLNQGQLKDQLGKSLKWKTTDSLIAGWKTLIDLAPGGEAIASNITTWQLAWKDPESLKKEQLSPTAWPAQPIDDVPAAPLEWFSAETAATAGSTALSDGGHPGCLTAGLFVASPEALAVVHNTTARPQLPPALIGGETAAETIRVDLTKEDLGKVLSGKKLQNGTVIVASGFGSRQSNPIVIQNAWVRLRFEQTEGYPLVLTPRLVDTGNAKFDAFISVTNGGLEISNGAFTIPASERQALPRWFIQAVDSDLVLRRCRLQGPMVGTTRNKGLIQWQRADGRPPTRPFTAPREAYAVFSDTYLLGSGTILEADLRHRALFLRNTVAIGRDDLFSFNIQGIDSQISAAVDMERSTLSAAGKFIQIQAAGLGAPTNQPLDIFADRCIFAPPLRTGQQKPTPVVVTYSGPLLEQKQLSWWENRCGYSPEITGYLKRDTDPPATSQDFDQTWVAQWGPQNVIEPIVGREGVFLRQDLPQKAEDRAKLEPEDLQLHTRAKAATGDDGKRPVGANVAAMNLPEIRAPSSSAPPKNKTGKPATGAVQGF